MQPRSDIDIVNNALARIGGGVITSLDEETDLARHCLAIYHDIVESAFSAWRWAFATKTFALTRLAETPENGYAHAHAHPAETIGPPQRLLTDPRAPENPVRDFECDMDAIYSDCQNLWGRYVRRLAPDLWPPLFRAAVTDWLAARLAVPVTHDAALAEKLERDAIGSSAEAFRGGMLGRAIAMDIAQSGGVAPLLASDPLTSVMRGSDQGWAR